MEKGRKKSGKRLEKRKKGENSGKENKQKIIWPRRVPSRPGFFISRSGSGYSKAGTIEYYILITLGGKGWKKWKREKKAGLKAGQINYINNMDFGKIEILNFGFFGGIRKNGL